MTPEFEARLIDAINRRDVATAEASLRAIPRRDIVRADLRYRYYRAQVFALQGRRRLAVRELRALRRSDESPMGTCFALLVMVSLGINERFTRRLLIEFETEVSRYSVIGRDKVVLKYLQLRLDEFRKKTARHGGNS